MSLPDDFSPWQHLREQLTVAHNLDVERSFFGIEPDDISTVFGAMRTAVFIQDDDTVDMILLRLFLYYFIFRQDLPTPIFGIPSTLFEETVVFKPQILLFFKEDYNLQLAQQKIASSEAEIKIRIANATDNTLSTAELTQLAERIKVLFAEGEGFTWEKGRTLVQYKDRQHSYHLQVYAESEAEGIRVIQRVLEIQEHPFNETLIRSTRINNQYPTGFHQVLNQEVKYPRKYPTARVRFRKAEAYLNGLVKPITLIDRTNKEIPLVQ